MTWRPAGPLLSGLRSVRHGDDDEQQRHEPAEQPDASR